LAARNRCGQYSNHTVGLRLHRRQFSGLIVIRFIRRVVLSLAGFLGMG
jgi:hypothetical protein